ncbi:hypothetical protein L1987_82023 [Smallanthus sonchifolius]|uniref:Uncharacterized protein n=2 Tax=Smallanthus sonchifolius TaxID=185202 RepID=A0ACB8YRE1_9ASTR|nr:hypothetical protein L1987_81995 [Smallanthus sonchifolius]KAI3688312.1 hypothetical protein L1987_82023 [Smallanthus sonchifolius]
MATTISTPLLILSIFFILSYILIPSFSCPSHQKHALLHFNSTVTTIINFSSYEPVELKSWNPTSDCCSWERVNCIGTKTVTELHLDGVIVPLPDVDPPLVFSNILAPLFHIRSLKLLDISNNYLHGETPGDGFENLTALVYLDMKDDDFNGSIPRQLFLLTNLRYLDMSNNFLKGKLGPELGSFRNFTTLSLSNNYFEGGIPSQLFELESLRVLDLSENILNGGLSIEVGKLLYLESLILSANFLSGKVPQEIGNLTKSRKFSLQNNHFSGGIPSSIVNLRKLEILDLSINLFSTQILTSIGTLPSITALALSENQFTGPIPSSMQNLSKLELLRLHDNKLSGEIPTWLFKITTLSSLFIGGSGLIWNNEAKIVPRCSLGMISMHSCNISGQIPEWLSTQKDMHLLDLSKNKLEGRFPDKLDTLDLSYNNFSSNIPTNFPVGIRFLYLGGNKLCGNLPWNLTKLVNLKILDVHANNITGYLHDTLPQISTLEALVLRNNSFEGYIPSSISNLSSLRILDLSHNNLTGIVPQEIGHLPGMIEPRHISTSFPIYYSIWGFGGQLYTSDLTVNWKKLLQGLTIRNIGTYCLLDLSHNRICGEMPPPLGQLKALKLLNISHNRISGHIPVSFGKIPVGGQMDTMNGFENNTGLCGMQINVTCPKDIRPVEEIGNEDEKQSWFLWEVTWVGFLVGFFSSILIMGYFLDFLRLFKIR